MSTNSETYELAARQRRVLLEAKAWDLAGTALILGGGFIAKQAVRRVATTAGIACYVRSDHCARVHGRLSDDLDLIVFERAKAQAPDELTPVIPGLEATAYQEVLDYTSDLPVAYIALARVAQRDALARAIFAALSGAVAMYGPSRVAPAILTLRAAHWARRVRELSLLRRDAKRMTIASTPGGSTPLRLRASVSRRGVAGLESRQRARQARRVRLAISTALYAQDQHDRAKP